MLMNRPDFYAARTFPNLFYQSVVRKMKKLREEKTEMLIKHYKVLFVLKMTS
jgi:hypothetical protein